MQTVTYCYSPMPFCKRGLDEGLNSIFWTQFTKNYSKIKTGFYFAFSYLTLQASTMLYFSYM